MDRETNRSRGFAFVKMSSDEEGKAAIARIKWKKKIEGRTLCSCCCKRKRKRLLMTETPIFTPEQ